MLSSQRAPQTHRASTVWDQADAPHHALLIGRRSSSGDFAAGSWRTVSPARGSVSPLNTSGVGCRGDEQLLPSARRAATGCFAPLLCVRSSRTCLPTSPPATGATSSSASPGEQSVHQRCTASKPGRRAACGSRAAPPPHPTAGRRLASRQSSCWPCARRRPAAARWWSRPRRRRPASPSKW